MVFHDPAGSRWRKFRAVIFVMAALALLLAADFLAGIFTTPKLASLGQSGFDQPVPAEAVDVVTPQLGMMVQSAPVAQVQQIMLRWGSRSSIFFKPFVRSAFLVQDDPQSTNDLQRNLARLDLVFPNWFTCPTASGDLQERVDRRAAQVLSSHAVKIFPRLANVDASGQWRGDELSELLNDYDQSHRLIQNLVSRLTALRADGIAVDMEDLHQPDRDAYLDWLQDLAAELHRQNLGVAVVVPLNEEAFDYEAIGNIADAVIVMGYDEHYPGGSPGPIASHDWFIDGIDELSQGIPPQKLIIALGAYGYDWNLSSKGPARSMGFADVMRVAAEHDAQVQTDAGNSAFEYRDADGAEHKVWFLDAISAWNQSLALKARHVGGVSLWRLGMEEPALWDAISSEGAGIPKSLSVVQSEQTISFQGEGELYRVRQLARAGQRQLSFDKNEFGGRAIGWAEYQQLPAGAVVERTGHDDSKRIALTFDDGPDPKWTPRILQVLANQNVQATFFLVGDQASHFPQLVKEELQAGHLLGSHTYYHPNLQQISETRLRAELNATQRVIETITGRQTLLFRAPYDTDSTPTEAGQLAPLRIVNQMGYIAVGADVDSDDYERPGVQRIISNVLEGLAGGSHIVVFHDAGGDRGQTADALAQLIPILKQQGYELVTVDRLLGASREAVMPPLPASERFLVTSNRSMNHLGRVGGWVLLVLFLLSAAVSILRIAFLSFFVLKSRRRDQESRSDHFAPHVLVLVPAYNEEKVIRRTLESVLKSDYPHFQVLVIDDGSSDGTADAALAVAAHDHRVRVLSVSNGGKAAALNRGFRQARQQYIITIDADTLIEPQTISRLIAPFADSAVDAVCGNVQVGNVRNMLTLFQDVEYVTSQNYDRRAFDALNCISVVPGATGAWRRDAVLEAGGYSTDTLTEDADLTLAVLRVGGRIVYAPEARSTTEAPQSARALFKQRFRWSFGTFQCLWKHRSALWRGSLGWVALPNMLLFQVLFPLLCPLGDVVFLLSILSGNFMTVGISYLLFLLVDLFGSFIAFRLDGRPVSRLWTVLVQRFYYRQFMYIVTFAALLAAIKGRRHGWNKLERKGTVTPSEHASMPAVARPPYQPAPAFHDRRRPIANFNPWQEPASVD